MPFASVKGVVSDNMNVNSERIIRDALSQWSIND